MINIGIVGCGKIAQVRHIPEYETNENARICGFYDINQERAGELAKKYQEKFKNPERFFRTETGIAAVPYKPVSKEMER